MLHRRWGVMEGLQEVDPPEGNSHRSYARKVAQQILDAYRGDVDPGTTVEAAGAASVIIKMSEQDRTVVTPEHIRDTSEMFAADVADVSQPELTMSIQSWLPFLDLQDVDTNYCSEWSRWDTIWIAPVFPRLDDITAYLDNPAAVSTSTIEAVIEESYTDSEQVDADAFAGGERELDKKELDAYLGYTRFELDEHWAPIANTDGVVWVNPTHLNENLSTEGGVLDFGDVVDKISDILVESSHVEAEVLPEEITAKNIGPVMTVLQESYGWRRLGTTTGISWYSDPETFEEAYEEHAAAAQEVLDNRKEASIEELQMSRTFFKHNQEVLLEFEDTSQHQLDGVVDRLGILTNMLKQEAKLDEATPGDSLSSTVRAKTPSAYHVAKEFEQKLEDMQVEEDEEDDNKGLGSYRY